MNTKALTAAVLPRHDTVEQFMRRAKQFEKLMRPNAALEASMRHVEQMEELMRPNAALEAAMRHNEQFETLMRPSPAMEAAMQHASQLERLMRPSPAMEAAMQHARQLEELMRPSAAFEESAHQAAQIADMLRPTRALTESLQRTKELADAMRPMRALEESLRRTQELVDAASIGNALRDFIWQGDSKRNSNSFLHNANITDEEPNHNEPELIVSREFEAESLLVADNRVLIHGCAPSLLALRRLFSKGVDLGKITWRELEEIVGELLSLEGYDVKVGRGTKDNGIDVLASKMLPHIGLLRTVWQAKHLQPGNKVELKAIRELADIRDQAQATKGIIVTTGFLTSGALKRIRQDAYRLGKMERPELEFWIKRMLRRVK
jgi:hypothetical protein